MKKLVLVLVLFVGLASTASAINMNSTKQVQTERQMKDFTPIEVKDLPEPIQKAIAAKYADATIKSAAFDTKDGEKIFKIVLLTKDSKEITTYYNEKGEEFE
jgi:hypothetical protein